MQWKIMQQKKPEDFVIATGKSHSVKDFVNEACKYLNMKISWSGKGLNTKAYYHINGKKELLIKVDKKYFRPLDIDYLKGDATKAFKSLNFKLKYSFKDLIKEMIDHDLKLAE